VDRAALEHLSAYIDWCWRQFADVIRPLGDEALVKPVPGSGWPALRDAIAHINWAYDRWIADPSRTSDLPVQPVNSWADAEAFRRRARNRFREYLDSLSDEELTTPREMNIDGDLASHAPADILTLLLLHEREHHGDLNTLLYQMGVGDPVQTSYRFFLAESGRSAQA
jgi:uncharacterized damage-inducible protein DinB